MDVDVGEDIMDQSPQALSKYYKLEFERVQREMDEFICESQQLEKEYETTIEQQERKIKELTQSCNKANNDNENLRTKVDQCNKQNVMLMGQIETLQAEKVNLTKYVRELEQKNDNLERSRRIIEESVATYEAAFHSAIERNAILESEVDEKELLKETLQRLADEASELKQELMVKEQQQSANAVTLNGYCNDAPMKMTPSIMDSNRLREMETQTTPVRTICDPMESGSPLFVPAKNFNSDYISGGRDAVRPNNTETSKSGGSSGGSFQSSPMTPASRILALNLVSELIRKVGGVERVVERNSLSATPCARKDVHSVTSKDLRSRRVAAGSPANTITTPQCRFSK